MVVVGGDIGGGRGESDIGDGDSYIDIGGGGGGASGNGGNNHLGGDLSHEV